MGYVQYTLDYLWHAILPVTCLSLFSLAGLAMYGRSAMLDVLGQDYIRTARAKGLSQGKVVFKHALRNGMIPIITLFANFLPAMLGGSVLIEFIFGIPGMGRLSFASILLQDYPTLMALIYIDAIVVMLSILMTDLLYVIVDPRISFGGRGRSA
jgi:peptide/nickel transport system permease protein